MNSQEVDATTDARVHFENLWGAFMDATIRGELRFTLVRLEADADGAYADWQKQIMSEVMP